MRKSVLAALVAASVLAPVAADAQEDRRGGRGRGEGATQAQPRQQQQQQQAQPEQRVPRTDFGGRGVEARGGFADRNRQAPQAQAEVQAQAQAQARPDFQRGDRGNRPDRGSGQRGQFQGGRGYNGGVVPPAQPPVTQQPRSDRNRGGAFNGYRGNGVGVVQQGYRSYDQRGNGRNDARNTGGGYRNDARGYNGYGGYNGGSNRAWSRDWRRDNRYDYSGYRNQNRNAFRLPRYYAPYGWSYGYRRFSVGFTLSSILFDQDYWIDDPFYYRLPPAYGQYRWVRYYNDALLVDLRTGYVVDTVYDIFW